MNVIDISSWQRGLNLSSLFSANPDLDGVIVKSSGGVSYVQDTCDPWVQWLCENKKPWGFYHFLDDDGKHSSGRREAEFWVKNTSSYFGKGIPCADYEATAATHGTAYLKEFLDTVYGLTGVKPLVYCSLSVVQSQNFSAIAEAGYQLWVAQYADMNPVYGFVEKPWQKGSVSPFPRYVMHQYCGTGKLPGWNGALDFDKFYGGISEWNAIVGGGEEPPGVLPKEADAEIVMRVLKNEFGTGKERREKVIAEGYSYESVQSKINELYAVALSCRKKAAGNEEFLECICMILRNL